MVESAKSESRKNESRWVKVGFGGHEDARPAAITAVEAAVAGPDPRLLIAFGPAHYAPEEIAAAMAEVAPGVPAIGCSTTGHIGSSGTPDSGVVVLGLGGDLAVSTACGTDFNQRPREVGAEVAAALQPLPDKRNHVVLMLTDNLTGDQQDVVRGAYSSLGATVPLIGGVAGNGLSADPTWQLYDGKVVSDAVVAAAVSTDGPLGIAVRHGWHCDGEAMIATASAGNQVYTLDDRPALEVFLARHEAPAGIEHDPAAFEAFSLSRPLAIARRGEVAIRHVLRAQPSDGSVFCAAAIPKGAAVWLATTELEATLEATDEACAEAVAGLGGSAPQGMLVFDCAGRRGEMRGTALFAEWDRMRRHLDGAPVAGFYGNGEIARIHGANGFHNQTVVACALG